MTIGQGQTKQDDHSFTDRLTVLEKKIKLTSIFSEQKPSTNTVGRQML